MGSSVAHSESDLYLCDRTLTRLLLMPRSGFSNPPAPQHRRLVARRHNPRTHREQLGTVGPGASTCQMICLTKDSARVMDEEVASRKTNKREKERRIEVRLVMCGFSLVAPRTMPTERGVGLARSLFLWRGRPFHCSGHKSGSSVISTAFSYCYNYCISLRAGGAYRSRPECPTRRASLG